MLKDFQSSFLGMITQSTGISTDFCSQLEKRCTEEQDLVTNQVTAAENLAINHLSSIENGGSMAAERAIQAIEVALV